MLLVNVRQMRIRLDTWPFKLKGVSSQNNINLWMLTYNLRLPQTPSCFDVPVFLSVLFPHTAPFFAVLFGQFVVFQTLTSDVVEIYDGSSTDSALLSSIYGSHSGKT